MRRRLGRLRRSFGRRLRAFLKPPVPLRVGPYRPPVRTTPLTPAEEGATNAFHEAYYDAWLARQGAMDLAWFGFRTMKSPMDMWMYQEILAETKPDLVVECGTAFGGSSLYLASLLDVLGRGEVVTIDIQARSGQPNHPRISRLIGSSVDPAIVGEDTNVNGHPVVPDHGPGPMEAVDAFLPGAPEFVIDRDRERFMLTLNPRGYLRRVD